MSDGEGDGGGAGGASPVDSFEQHGELSAGQGDRTGLRLGPDEAASFEAFREETKAVAIEPEELDEVAATAAKDEDVAVERARFEGRLDEGAEAVEPASHVGYAGGDPDLRGGGEGDHGRWRGRRRLRCGGGRGGVRDEGRRWRWQERERLERAEG